MKAKAHISRTPFYQGGNGEGCLAIKGMASGWPLIPLSLVSFFRVRACDRGLCSQRGDQVEVAHPAAGLQSLQHNYRLLVPGKPWGILARTGPKCRCNPAQRLRGPEECLGTKGTVRSDCTSRNCPSAAPPTSQHVPVSGRTAQPYGQGADLPWSRPALRRPKPSPRDRGEIQS